MLIAVRAAARDGYKGVFRAGRFWPSDDEVVVEVLDQEDDPPSDPFKIGKRSMTAIERDARLSIRTDGSVAPREPRAEQPNAKRGRG